ncbi:protease inhibitor I42 family protein [Microvirga sp. 0TCS3.31]
MSAWRDKATALAFCFASTIQVASAQVMDLTDTPTPAHHIEVAVGKTMSVRLKRNSGTPFTWIARGNDPSVVEITEREKVDLKTSDRIVGFPQLQVFEIRGLMPGTTEIDFDFERPRGQPVETIYLFVEVIDSSSP